MKFEEPSRRTVIGAAWALPVVAIAVATPSAAASVAAGSVEFDRPEFVMADDEFGVFHGIYGWVVMPQNIALPSQVSLTYSANLEGQTTAPVYNGYFTVPAVYDYNEYGTRSLITATAPGLSSTSAVLVNNTVGIISTSPPTTIGAGTRVTVTGAGNWTSTNNRRSLPASISITYTQASGQPISGDQSVSPVETGTLGQGTFSYSFTAPATPTRLTILASAYGWVSMPVEVDIV